MKWLRRGLIALVGLVSVVALLIAGWWLLPPRTAPIPGERAIASLQRVVLGGFEQTILLRGRDAAKPVFLYLHGGPGAAMLPIAPYYSQQLEEHFVVVHWDQRGAGASCEGVDWNSLTLERAVSDAIELSEILAQRPGTGGKVVLLGHSWGSVVGALAVHRRPDLYDAYVGLGQVVNGRRNEELSYQWVNDEARRRGDEEALAVLAGISPPYETTEELVTQRKWLHAYDGSFYALDQAWSVLPAALFGREYTLATRLMWYECFLRSVDAMWGVFDEVDFPTQIPRLEVPVFFFAGRHDWNTPYPLVEEWARTLQAPSVEIVWFDDAGHMIPLESRDAFERELISRLVPLPRHP
jgi:pimeloyl-ACP methyl ester carboxylesterase